jgi:hypothetical protein
MPVNLTELFSRPPVVPAGNVVLKRIYHVVNVRDHMVNENDHVVPAREDVVPAREDVVKWFYHVVKTKTDMAWRRENVVFGRKTGVLTKNKTVSRGFLMRSAACQRIRLPAGRKRRAGVRPGHTGRGGSSRPIPRADFQGGRRTLTAAPSIEWGLTLFRKHPVIHPTIQEPTAVAPCSCFSEATSRRWLSFFR